LGLLVHVLFNGLDEALTILVAWVMIRSFVERRLACPERLAGLGRFGGEDGSARSRADMKQRR
jgi:hypothetical protein